MVSFRSGLVSRSQTCWVATHTADRAATKRLPAQAVMGKTSFARQKSKRLSALGQNPQDRFRFPGYVANQFGDSVLVGVEHLEALHENIEEPVVAGFRAIG